MVGEKKRSVNCSRFSFFYRPAGATFAIAGGVGVASFKPHSLHLCLTLLLHCTLNTSLFHMRVGGYFRLYGMTLEYLCERECQHKKGDNDDAHDDYYENGLHFLA